MNTILSISEIIGKNSAILHSDGMLFSDVAKKAFNKSDIVEIDFSGLEFCTTAFLNAAIGGLLLKNPKLINKLEFIGIEDNSIIKIKINEVLDLVQNELKRKHQDSTFMSYQFS